MLFLYLLFIQPPLLGFEPLALHFVVEWLRESAQISIIKLFSETTVSLLPFYLFTFLPFYLFAFFPFLLFPFVNFLFSFLLLILYLHSFSPFILRYLCF